MSKKVILLSAAGLKNLSLNNNDEVDQFHFHFGDKEIKMNTFFAEFISPFVSHLHKADPTIDSINFESFMMNTPDVKSILSDDILSILVQLSRGYSITVNEEQSNKLLLTSTILGNGELFNKVNEIYPIDTNESKIDFYLQLLQLSRNICVNLGSYSQFNYTAIIDFLSENFESIDKQKLFSLHKSVLYSILSNTNLQIDSEDSLLDLIMQIFQNESKNNENDEYNFIDFLELIEFDELSEEKFKSFVFSFNASKMTNSLLRKICSCFLTDSENESKVHKKRISNLKSEKFKYDGDSSHSLKGIIHHLTQKCGGNVSEKGIVNVKASSIQSDWQLPKCAVDFDDKEKYFHSNPEKNAWLMYDFGELKVHPTHYTMRSRGDGGKNSHHLQNWVIEGSNSGNENDWKVLDTRNDVSVLNDKLALHTFKIQTPINKNESFRYLRVRLTGPDTYSPNCYHLILSALEYFGTIFHST